MVPPKGRFLVSPSGEKRETLAAWQVFFDRVDQLGDADGLRKKRMPLNIETTFCLGSGYQRRKKYDRRILQFRIGLNSCRYFASVGLWHHDIEQDEMWPKSHGALMGLGSVVFFEHQILPCPFEKNFHQVSGGSARWSAK